MRVGSLVYATQQGLGILAKSFVDHGIVTDVIVIAHGTHQEQPWYPESYRITNMRDPEQAKVLRKFCESMDVMLFFETPFDWSLMAHCKKSVLMTMYECTPANLPAYPDLFLYPSLLDKKAFEDHFPVAAGRGVFLPVPVDTTLVPWKMRQKAEVFVHNAGHGGLKGRNGTRELYTALQYVKAPIKLILRTQSRIDQHLQTHDTTLKIGNVTVDYQYGSRPYGSLFSQGDVFVFPEKFNGLSLPLQEAYASGMLVMCGDRFPMNTWLPKDPLIPVFGYSVNRIGGPYMTFQEAQFEPKRIAETIDSWYGQDIAALSIRGRVWASENNWDTLKPKYVKLLESL